ncbi:restriction endonuclease subunit S [Planctopirus hydrillae]|uniref:Type I restriction modification DNA specificity domain-containing protein n=1 Tax=Planctopirus hydrillae TaxID=1841610 RepID=A0A1C3ENX6_9PLAN|nr:restriction endonuclease subunit S [Planctopirus hydrillae]ODA34953.1 hypothetical protein A6X21_04765 [Planctopirus hydrillae]
MKLETFFEKFDQFADAPNAVAKMRELVLELAVRGRLLISCSPDSSAPSDSSNPFSIPHDWQWITLNKAADCRVAAKVDSASLNDSDWVLDLEDIDGDAGKVIATATFAERRSLSTKASFQKGDVLYGKLRPYLNKVVVADRPGFCTTEIIPLRPQKSVEAGYLRLFLRSPHFLRYAAAKNYGMKMPRLGTQDLESAAIPLPPLAEQKRIVAKVDELMALCDRLEAQQQERETRHAALARASLARFADAPTPANLDFLFHKSYDIPPADLRKSILTLAVQGKLVPQDPNDEPAEASSETESPFEIPGSWQWKPLGTLGLCKTGRTPPTSDPSNYGSGFPFIGPGQITPSGDITASEKTITSKGLESSTEANALDILMVCIGGSIGKAALCREPLGFNQQINSVRLRHDLPEFVHLAVTSAYFQEQVLTNASGSATPIINKGKWERIPVPIPPLAEQRRIVAKVEQLMALVDALETQLAASRTTAANLLSALVAELTA